MPRAGHVHDRAILDALDALVPVRFDGAVWRITKAGQSAAQGSTANGRWSLGGAAEVLYTSVQRDGALAEIGYRLSLEPVWPSRLRHELHRLTVLSERTLTVADVASLAPLGVDVSHYQSFNYEATQALAAAAHFLEFDGLLVPSARHDSMNLVLFMNREIAASVQVISTEPVDWAGWRNRSAPPMAKPK